jgi:hypothetical protein
MTDNVRINEGSGPPIATREGAYSGETAHMQVVGLATAVGPDDAKVLADVSEANPLPVADTNSGNLLLRILQMLMAPLGYDKSLQRQRGTVLVESGTITTVSTLSNITSVGGYPAQMQIIDANRTAWALNVRARIT